MANILVDDVQMSHEGMITMTFGHKMKSKKGTSHGQVLKRLAQLFPPQRTLLHVEEENLIVTSQEETLSQTEYIYQHPNIAGLDIKMIKAVLRLQVVKKGRLVTYGTGVVCNKEGMCLRANHCLEAAGVKAKDKRLRVGGHAVEIIAQDVDVDIACLQITNGDDIDFDFVPFDYMLVPQMKIQLISYPHMVEEFMMATPTITHGQLDGILNHFQCTGDYACFSNSLRGVVFFDDKLVGIHVEATYLEEYRKKKKFVSHGEMLELVDKNLDHKCSLGIFVVASAIGAFLVKHKIIPDIRIQASLTSQSRSPVMVSARLCRK